ncbi:YmdB family metallophosphoesterase [Candidatus Parcubacteria bacterium]|nr:MAG: YmdB family metallophosphoesterase [Candidatus Parcubacteria bacterium]
MPDKTKIIFIGDISGVLGRQGVRQIIPEFKKKYSPDIFVGNIENLAHNKGVTLKTLAEVAEAGIEMFTGGNHIWKKYDIPTLAKETDYQISCPINDYRTPQKYRYQTREINGTKLIVINLAGRTFISFEDEPLSNPFLEIDKLLEELPKNANIIIDMHAESTSDKRAMGFYLDGRVSAVFGTHTHVPTADAQILAHGTGYITDVGMTGAHDSVLGIKKEIIIEKFVSEGKIIHDLPRTGQIEINALLLEIDNKTHKTTHIELLRKIIN